MCGTSQGTQKAKEFCSMFCRLQYLNFSSRYFLRDKLWSDIYTEGVVQRHFRLWLVHCGRCMDTRLSPLPQSQFLRFPSYHTSPAAATVGTLAISQLLSSLVSYFCSPEVSLQGSSWAASPQALNALKETFQLLHLLAAFWDTNASCGSHCTVLSLLQSLLAVCVTCGRTEQPV